MKFWEVVFSALLRRANWTSTRNRHANQVLKESNGSTCYFQMLVSVWYLSHRHLKILVYSILGFTIGRRIQINLSNYYLVILENDEQHLRLSEATKQ